MLGHVVDVGEDAFQFVIGIAILHRRHFAACSKSGWVFHKGQQCVVVAIVGDVLWDVQLRSLCATLQVDRVTLETGLSEVFEACVDGCVFFDPLGKEPIIGGGKINQLNIGELIGPGPKL